MANYSVVFSKSAGRELGNLEQAVSLRVLSKIEALATKPRPAGCRKLTGADDLWRIRIGDYRVIYAIDDDAGLVDIVAIRHRRDAYR